MPHNKDKVQSESFRHLLVRLFAGMWRPGRVLLQHSVTLRLVFMLHSMCIAHNLCGEKIIPGKILII